jgi:cellulose synthase operon protein C
LVNLARLDLAQGKPAAAEPSFKRILEKDPKNLLATLGMAATAGAGKDAAAAEKWLVKASADHPESAEAQLALAQYHLAANDLAKAKAVVDKATKANPQNAGLANARGLVLLGTRDVPARHSEFWRSGAARTASGRLQAEPRPRADSRQGHERRAGDNRRRIEEQPEAAARTRVGSDREPAVGRSRASDGLCERLRQAAPDSQVSNQIEGDLAMAQKRYKEALGFYEKADPAGQNRNIVIARYVAASARTCRSHRSVGGVGGKEPTRRRRGRHAGGVEEQQGRQGRRYAALRTGAAGIPRQRRAAE